MSANVEIHRTMRRLAAYPKQNALPKAIRSAVNRQGEAQRSVALQAQGQATQGRDLSTLGGPGRSIFLRRK